MKQSTNKRRKSMIKQESFSDGDLQLELVSEVTAETPFQENVENVNSNLQAIRLEIPVIFKEEIPDEPLIQENSVNEHNSNLTNGNSYYEKVNDVLESFTAKRQAGKPSSEEGELSDDDEDGELSHMSTEAEDHNKLSPAVAELSVHTEGTLTRSLSIECLYVKEMEKPKITYAIPFNCGIVKKEPVEEPLPKLRRQDSVECLDIVPPPTENVQSVMVKKEKLDKSYECSNVLNQTSVLGDLPTALVSKESSYSSQSRPQSAELSNSTVPPPQVQPDLGTVKIKPELVDVASVVSSKSSLPDLVSNCASTSANIQSTSMGLKNQLPGHPIVFNPTNCAIPVLPNKPSLQHVPETVKIKPEPIDILFDSCSVSSKSSVPPSTSLISSSVDSSQDRISPATRKLTKKSNSIECLFSTIPSTSGAPEPPVRIKPEPIDDSNVTRTNSIPKDNSATWSDSRVLTPVPVANIPVVGAVAIKKERDCPSSASNLAFDDVSNPRFTLPVASSPSMVSGDLEKRNSTPVVGNKPTTSVEVPNNSSVQLRNVVKQETMNIDESPEMCNVNSNMSSCSTNRQQPPVNVQHQTLPSTSMNTRGSALTNSREPSPVITTIPPLCPTIRTSPVSQSIEDSRSLMIKKEPTFPVETPNSNTKAAVPLTAVPALPTSLPREQPSSANNRASSFPLVSVDLQETIAESSLKVKKEMIDKSYEKQEKSVVGKSNSKSRVPTDVPNRLIPENIFRLTMNIPINCSNTIADISSSFEQPGSSADSGHFPEKPEATCYENYNGWTFPPTEAELMCLIEFSGRENVSFEEKQIYANARINLSKFFDDESHVRGEKTFAELMAEIQVGISSFPAPETQDQPDAVVSVLFPVAGRKTPPATVTLPPPVEPPSFRFPALNSEIPTPPRRSMSAALPNTNINNAAKDFASFICKEELIELSPSLMVPTVSNANSSQWAFWGDITPPRNAANLPEITSLERCPRPASSSSSSSIPSVPIAQSLTSDSQSSNLASKFSTEYLTDILKLANPPTVLVTDCLANRNRVASPHRPDSTEKQDSTPPLEANPQESAKVITEEDFLPPTRYNFRSSTTRKRPASPFSDSSRSSKKSSSSSDSPIRKSPKKRGSKKLIEEESLTEGNEMEDVPILAPVPEEEVKQNDSETKERDDDDFVNNDRDSPEPETRDLEKNREEPLDKQETETPKERKSRYERILQRRMEEGVQTHPKFTQLQRSKPLVQEIDALPLPGVRIPLKKPIKAVDSNVPTVSKPTVLETSKCAVPVSPKSTVPISPKNNVDKSEKDNTTTAETSPKRKLDKTSRRKDTEGLKRKELNTPERIRPRPKKSKNSREDVESSRQSFRGKDERCYRGTFLTEPARNPRPRPRRFEARPNVPTRPVAICIDYLHASVPDLDIPVHEFENTLQPPSSSFQPASSTGYWANQIRDPRLQSHRHMPGPQEQERFDRDDIDNEVPQQGHKRAVASQYFSFSHYPNAQTAVPNRTSDWVQNVNAPDYNRPSAAYGSSHHAGPLLETPSVPSNYSNASSSYPPQRHPSQYQMSDMTPWPSFSEQSYVPSQPVTGHDTSTVPMDISPSTSPAPMPSMAPAPSHRLLQPIMMQSTSSLSSPDSSRSSFLSPQLQPDHMAFPGRAPVVKSIHLPAMPRNGPILYCNEVCVLPLTLQDVIGHKIVSRDEVILTSLAWSCNWLNDTSFVRSHVSPLTPSITYSYKSFNEYFVQYSACLLHEFWDRIYSTWKSQNKMAAVFYCKSSGLRGYANELDISTASIEKHPKCDSCFVLITFPKSQDNRNGPSVFGYICNHNFEKLASGQKILHLNVHIIYRPEIIYSGTPLEVQVHFLSDFLPTLNQIDAMCKLQKSAFFKGVLNPQTLNWQKILLERRRSCTAEDLRDSARNIVNSLMISSKGACLTIVESPIGSEPVNHLIAVIEYLKCNRLTTDKRPILLCCRSSKKLEEISFRLTSTSGMGEQVLNTLLLVKPAKIHKELKRHTLDYKVTSHMRDSSDSSKKFKDENAVKKFLLENVDVVLALVTTCYSHTANSILKEGFVCAILYEAAMCTEPESLIPLIYNVDKYILFFDPQLNATVNSPFAKGRNFGLSFVRRLLNFRVM